MKKNKRQRAAQVAAALDGEGAVAQTPHVLQRLVHELRVHQIELEAQNEELRAARMDAEQAREQFSQLFHAAPSGHLTLDQQNMIVEGNRAALRMLGRTKRELERTSLAQLVMPPDRARLAGCLRESRACGRAHCELRLQLPDGGTPIVRIDVSPIPDCQGQCLLVLTDMSERQRDQELLRQANQELEQRVAARTAELEAQNRQLQAEIEARALAQEQRRQLEGRLREAERLRSLGLLAAGIAHDFNNLLVSIVGNADMMLRAPGLPSGCVDPLRMMRQTGQDASELTRQLLVFAGLGRPVRAPMQLGEIVDGCVALLRPRCGASVRVLTALADTGDPILADRSQVQRVVMNLLTNALEALDGGGTIEVGARCQALGSAELREFLHASAAQPGEYVVLHVADSGRGVDPAGMQRIFEPFYSTKFTGRGLGLASVLGIVQSHCGAIRVSGQPGAGTRFEIAFPRGEPQPISRPAAPAAANDWRASGAALLIEDNHAVRGVVSKQLRAMGFDVAAVDGGERGLALLAETPQRFDVVLLDWVMPGMSGESVLRELRRRDPSLPVVLMSGYSADTLGADDPLSVRLQKPMTFEQLQAAVRTVLASADEIKRSAGRRYVTRGPT